MVRQSVAHDVHRWMMSSFATVRCDIIDTIILRIDSSRSRDVFDITITCCTHYKYQSQGHGSIVTIDGRCQPRYGWHVDRRAMQTTTLPCSLGHALRRCTMQQHSSKPWVETLLQSHKARKNNYQHIRETP